LSVGDTVQYLDRKFQGTGYAPGCLRILNELLNKADPSDCHPKPCAIGTVYQPTIHKKINFYAVGGFRYALRDIGAVRPDGIFVPQTGFVKGAEFCSSVRITQTYRI